MDMLRRLISCRIIIIIIIIIGDQAPELGEYKGSVGSCSGVLNASAVSSVFFVVLDPRGRLGGLGGKVGSACEEFKDYEGGILG